MTEAEDHPMLLWAQATPPVPPPPDLPCPNCGHPALLEIVRVTQNRLLTVVYQCRDCLRNTSTRTRTLAE